MKEKLSERIQRHVPHPNPLTPGSTMYTTSSVYDHQKWLDGVRELEAELDKLKEENEKMRESFHECVETEMWIRAQPLITALKEIEAIAFTEDPEDFRKCPRIANHVLAMFNGGEQRA